MRRKKEEMYTLVSIWQPSNETKTSFCKTHSINIHTFNYWLKKYTLSKTDSSASVSKKFVPLQVLPQDSQGFQGEFGGIELYYPNGVRLRLTSEVSTDYIACLVRINSNQP